MNNNFYNKYPYTDFHELNLDWVLSKIKTLEDAIEHPGEDNTSLLCILAEDIDVRTDNTADLNSANINTFLFNHRGEAVLLKFSSGVYHFSDTIIIYPQHCFMGYETNNQSTILDFDYPGLTSPAFKISAAALDPAYAYGYKNNSFINIRLTGNHNRHGIDYGLEQTNDLINTPNLIFRNVDVFNFNYGVICEGYGHTFMDVQANGCNIGLFLLHPEQDILLNCWCQSNDIGLAVNNKAYKLSEKYAFYGHSFHIIGGSYQRNRIGIYLWNSEEVYISTYCEINTHEDILIGDPDDRSNYTKGCKNIDIKYNYTPVAREAGKYSIRTYGTVGAIIKGCTDAATSDYLYADGYCKYFFVYTTPEKTQNVNASGTIAETITFFNNFTVDYGDLGTYRTVRHAKGFSERVGFAEGRYGINYLLDDGGLSVSANDNTSRVTFNLNGSEYSFTHDAAEFYNMLKIRNGNLLQINNAGDTDYIAMKYESAALQAYFSNSWHKVVMTDSNNNVIIKTPDGSNSCVLQFDGTNLKAYINGTWKTLAFV